MSSGEHLWIRGAWARVRGNREGLHSTSALYPVVISVAAIDDEPSPGTSPDCGVPAAARNAAIRCVVDAISANRHELAVDRGVTVGIAQGVVRAVEGEDQRAACTAHEPAEGCCVIRY